MSFQTKPRILLSDPQGVFEAVVGSHDWLSEPVDSHRKTLSYRVSHSAAVARLCLTLADMISYDERLRTSAAVVGLRNAAAKLERQAKGDKKEESDLRHHISLVFDQYHYNAIRSAARATRPQMVIVSENTNCDFALQLLKSAMDGSTPAESTVELIVDPGISDLLRRKCREMQLNAFVVTDFSNVAANALFVGDDCASISSCAWLSDVIDSPRPSGFEVGVVVQGDGVGSHVRKLLTS